MGEKRCTFLRFRRRCRNIILVVQARNRGLQPVLQLAGQRDVVLVHQELQGYSFGLELIGFRSAAQHQVELDGVEARQLVGDGVDAGRQGSIGVVSRSEWRIAVVKPRPVPVSLIAVSENKKPVRPPPDGFRVPRPISSGWSEPRFSGIC